MKSGVTGAGAGVAGVTPPKRIGDENLAKASLRFSRLKIITPSDAARLKELAYLLDKGASFNVRLLRRSVRDGVTRIFVLRREERIAASATAVVFSTPTGRHCRIEDVVVDGTLRGLGLGREIMTRTLAALAKEGIEDVELTSRPSRLAAQALYRSLGFEKRETDVFKLQLNSD